MSIHLFIDTNVYLKFYHYSSDDLDELSKLLVLLDDNKLELYLPEQVVNEFDRNRDAKLADALKTFSLNGLGNQFPQFCKEYAEYEKMRGIIRSYNKEKQVLLNKILLAINSFSLKADKMINALFEKANSIEVNLELLEKSKIRFDLGNPPGKNKSYGDAVNWEALLKEVETGIDLHFIADDKDYLSELNNKKFNSFLEREWKNKKRSEIKFYKTLSDFFMDVFPEIKLGTKVEKEELIAKLISNRNTKM